MRRYLLVTAILVVAALFAGVFLGPRVFKPALASAEERWFASPRSDYTMKLERQCFCPWPQTYTVTVRGGEPTQIVSDGQRLSVREARGVGTPLTVEDLFMLVHELVARHGSGKVRSTYDPQWGYPVTIETGGEANTQDDEISVAVTSFQEGK